MKLSSFQRISGLLGWDVGLKDGEFICEWKAVLTIPHRRHPDFGTKLMKLQTEAASLFSSSHSSSIPSAAQTMSEVGNGLRSKDEIQSLFDALRSQLDSFQDTREKLVKVNT